MPAPTFWLSFHVTYSCRHTGACCSSGWDIDIEHARIGPIASAIAQACVSAPARWYRPVDGAPADVAGVLAHSGHGHCVFHRAPGCAIQSAIGHEALPAACQHFPRIALIDRRGVSVTLSHYCPTAASLLIESRGPATIVSGPPVLPGGDLPEGLDARDELPPLDSPRRLMDWDEYSRWEREAVARLTGGDPPVRVLDELDRGAPRMTNEALFALACDAVPSPHVAPSFTREVAEDGSADHVVGNYLAAHAFASWTAYQGNGLHCTVLYLRLALAVLNSERARTGSLLEGIRQSDLLLRHLVDRQRLTDRLSALAAR